MSVKAQQVNRAIPDHLGGMGASTGPLSPAHATHQTDRDERTVREECHE